MVLDNTEQSCTCKGSGECSCEPFECFCECECEECVEKELDGCPCGGNCGCGNQEKIMNPMKIISLGMTFYGKVTNSEKAKIVKEIKEFSKVSIKAIEKITLLDSN